MSLIVNGTNVSEVVVNGKTVNKIRVRQGETGEWQDVKLKLKAPILGSEMTFLQPGRVHRSHFLYGPDITNPNSVTVHCTIVVGFPGSTPLISWSDSLSSGQRVVGRVGYVANGQPLGWLTDNPILTVTFSAEGYESSSASMVVMRRLLQPSVTARAVADGESNYFEFSVDNPNSEAVTLNWSFENLDRGDGFFEDIGTQRVDAGSEYKWGDYLFVVKTKLRIYYSDSKYLDSPVKTITLTVPQGPNKYTPDDESTTTTTTTTT